MKLSIISKNKLPFNKKGIEIVDNLKSASGQYIVELDKLDPDLLLKLTESIHIAENELFSEKELGERKLIKIDGSNINFINL